MMKLRTQLTLGYILVLSIMALISLVVYLNLRSLIDNSRWVQHTHRVIGEANELIGALVDQETGVRGFLVTGKDSYLESYIKGKEVFGKKISELTDTVSDNTEEVRSLEKIQIEAAELDRIFFTRAISLRREVNKGVGAETNFREIQSRVVGKEIFDELRALISNIKKKMIEANDLRGEIILNEAYINFLDMETGQRGFLLTGLTASLEPYYDGHMLFHQNLDELRRHIIENSVLGIAIQELDRIEAKVDEWIDKAAAPEIAARERMNEVTTTMFDIIDFMGTGVGKQYMDDLRVQVKDFIREEKILLTKRIEQEKRTVIMTTGTSLVGTFISVLIGVFIIFWIMHSVMTQLGAEPAIVADFAKKIANGELPPESPKKGKGLAGVLMEIVASLKKLTNRFEIAEVAADIGSWEWDIASDRLFLSKGAKEIIGIEAEGSAYPYTGLMDIIHTDDKPHVQERMKRAFEDDMEYICDYRICLPEDNLRWLSVRGSITRDKEGNPHKMYGIFHDTTAQNQAQEKAANTENLLQTVIDNSPTPVFTRNLNGEYLIVNTEFCRMLGLPKEAVLGHSYEDIFSTERTARHKEIDSKTLQQKTPVVFEESHRIKGEKHQYLANQFCLFDNNGSPTGICGIYTDITRQKEAETSIMEYSIQLEKEVAERTKELAELHEEMIKTERLLVIGQLGGKISHEMRNPLTAVKNASIFLSKKLEEKDPKIDKHLKILLKESSRMENLISEFFKLTDNKPLSLHIQDINRILKKIIASMKIPENITIQEKFEKNISPIPIDEEQITRLISNLVTNSCDAMKTGGILTISSSIHHDSVEICVSDTGGGIPAANLPLIFDPLYSTKTYGVGLGLSIVKDSAARLNADFSAENTDDGFTFCLSLPIRQVLNEKIS